MLITPLSEAHGILTRRNPATGLAALHTELAPELYRVQKAKQRTITGARATSALQATTCPEDARPVRADSPLRAVARTGLYDANRYASDSEARMAVLNHFAACKWTVEQVRAGLAGQYAGLAALYGDKAERLLPLEWEKAQAWTTAKPTSQKDGRSYARINDTSPTKLTGGSQNHSTHAIHQLVNDIENVLYAVLDQRCKIYGRASLSLRLLLRAVLGYMRTTQKNLLDVGCRTFAVALGKDHATIARLLPVLEKASEGILTRVQRGHGRNADTYLIQLPPHFEQLARDLTWRQGKIHAIRPVFRVLGDVAALTYEAIERGRHSPTTAELVRSTGISRTATTEALTRMETLRMIRRHYGRWEIVATTGLQELADRLGATEDRQEQITRYRKERAAWHAWLDRHVTPQIDEHDIYDWEADEYWLPPTDPGELQASLWQAA